MITSAALDRYRRDGYLVLRGALPEPVARGLRLGLERLRRTWLPTGDSYEQVLHQLHHPWLLDDDIAGAVTDPTLAAAAAALSGIPSVSVFLDQAIVKPPGGLCTIAHQDAPFLSFDDERSLNCWIPLDHTTADNGALSYVRGSHRLGVLPRIHLDEGDDLRLLEPRLAGLPLDRVEMAPGDLVFHNCRTVHEASANRTERPRAAFSLQYMAADARYNGYPHDFLRPFEPRIGAVLDFPCFAVPRVAAAAGRRQERRS